MFRNCRKACKWRYIEELVPLERDHNLYFGSVIHECLELWHASATSPVLDHIDRTYVNRAQGDEQQGRLAPGHGDDEGLRRRYPSRGLRGRRAGEDIRGPIVNPATGASSRSFMLAGKVDGIVRQDGQYFLLEHKTASPIDAGYLERLWTDFQITSTPGTSSRRSASRISGIIYNVLVKARLRQSQGETEAEFEARRAELIAKSKTGKTSAKRKMPEERRGVPGAPAAKVRRAGDVPPRDAVSSPATSSTRCGPNCGS